MLPEFDVFIAFTPIGDEPDFSDFLRTAGVTAPVIRLPARREADPFAAATSLAAAHADKKVCILIPGRAFDAAGARRGRGGGWYDRFLSAVPRAWLRIGVLNAPQLSAEPLKREPWDEPMDALLVKEKSGWKTLSIQI